MDAVRGGVRVLLVAPAAVRGDYGDVGAVLPAMELGDRFLPGSGSDSDRHFMA